MLRGSLHGNCRAGRRIKGYALAVLILSHCLRGWEHRGCPCASVRIPPAGWRGSQLLPGSQHLPWLVWGTEPPSASQTPAAGHVLPQTHPQGIPSIRPTHGASLCPEVSPCPDGDEPPAPWNPSLAPWGLAEAGELLLKGEISSLGRCFWASLLLPAIRGLSQPACPPGLCWGGCVHPEASPSRGLHAGAEVSEPGRECLPRPTSPPPVTWIPP